MFKPDMIKAIIEGRKTQTRRLSGYERLNREPDKWTYHSEQSFPNLGRFIFQYDNQKPYHRELATVMVKSHYQVREVVYIKEACCVECFKRDGIEDACYKYDEDTLELNEIDCEEVNWRSPLFMPAWAACHFIRITDVRAERLWKITEEDAKAEGVTRPPNYSLTHHYREWFKYLWNTIHKKKDRWEDNPWVWLYSFERLNR